MPLFVYGPRYLALRPLRTVAQVLAIGAALSLLGSVLLFVQSSLSTMTSASAARVTVDWQAPVPDADMAARLSAALAHHRGIEESQPAAVAGFRGASHTSGGTVSTAGSGGILVVRPDYLGALRPFHLLRGGLSADGVVLSQPLASALQARIGDPVQVQLANGASPPLRVTGIVVVDAADLLFQPLGPAATGAPPAPPAEVVVVPPGLFSTSIAPLLGSPATGPAGVSTPPVQWQVQAQVSRSILKGDPSAAVAELDTFRHVIERSFPGQLGITDNLAGQLNTAAEQALYAESLFIFLALPGVVISLALAYYAAAAGGEEERRYLALLRARGADLRDLVVTAVTQGGLIAVGAWMLGIAAARAAAPVILPGSYQPSTRQVEVAAIALLLVSLLSAIGARIAAVTLARRRLVAESRAVAPRVGRPLWQRLYLDLLALLGAAGVFAIDRVTGLSAVVTPDSNPTVALSIYSFLAPTLLWLGVTLLLVRIGSAILRRTAAALAGARSRSLRRFLLQSTSRRAPAINRAMVLIGLLLSFAISLSLFAATYQQQSLVDAQLTLGADVVATSPPGSEFSEKTLAAMSKVPGAKAVSALRHTFAYVGPDLQDMFAIDATSIGTATTLRDSYVSGARFSQLLQRLRATPDGILVSQETIKDYGLATGDLLKLRLLDEHTGSYRVVSFHVLGVVSEFPAAPKDSFLVANLGYVSSQTNAAGPDTVFIASRTDPPQTAAGVRELIGSAGGVVRDITGQVALTSSSLTAVNLSGISRLEEVFAVLLAAASVILFAILTTIERRREFALMAAMGTRLRVMGSFLWTEALLVSAASAMLAAVLGTLLAVMLIAILTHVFDPPPEFLALPWSYLLLLFAATAAGTLVGGLAGMTALYRLQLSPVLRAG